MAGFEFYNGSHTGQDIDRLLDLVPEHSEKIEMLMSGIGGGEDLHVTIEHSVSEIEWNVVHNLGKRPSVTITTYEGNEVIGEVKYVDNNTIRIKFGNPMSGYVILN